MRQIYFMCFFKYVQKKLIGGASTMDFIDTLKQFSARAGKHAPQVKNEEATKTSLVMPFFQAVFGYDIFNPDEFVPEFTADVGIKKGEKVDYAIVLGGNPVILIEAKWCGESLDKHDSQLFRYFGTTKAKFGILTNGLVYKFYTDLDEQNKMDLTPFLELDILNIKDSLVPELKRFCKTNFDASEIFGRASELKYSNEIRAYFTEQLKEPSDEFVRFMISCTYEGRATSAVVEKFRPIVKTSLNSLISEMMSDRITTALKKDSATEEPVNETSAAPQADEEAQQVQSEPSQDEILAYKIIKAILVEQMDVNQITYKKTVHYFAVLYGDASSKRSSNWICRINVGLNKSYIAFPTEGKDDKSAITSVNDLYAFKDNIIASAKRFV